MKHEVVHKPVLLQRVIEYLKIDPAGTYVDCTLGDGGYSAEILRYLGDSGILVSIDWDQLSIDFVKSRFSEIKHTAKWHIVRGNFVDLSAIMQSLGIHGVQGVVFDLGVSSRQLDADEYERGFSFMSSHHLDMRMDTRLNVTAEDLIKVLGNRELERIFAEYGEERYARRIAIEVKEYVRAHPYESITTDRLAALVRKVVPAGYRKGSKHPARRVFQALRIAVNNELHNLQQALASALSISPFGSRIVVVTYHSLEDRIVKNFFRDQMQVGAMRVLTPKPCIPDARELELNERAHSAKLRAAEVMTNLQ